MSILSELKKAALKEEGPSLRVNKDALAGLIDLCEAAENILIRVKGSKVNKDIVYDSSCWLDLFGSVYKHYQQKLS